MYRGGPARNTTSRDGPERDTRFRAVPDTLQLLPAVDAMLKAHCNAVVKVLSAAALSAAFVAGICNVISCMWLRSYGRHSYGRPGYGSRCLGNSATIAAPAPASAMIDVPHSCFRYDHGSCSCCSCSCCWSSSGGGSCCGPSYSSCCCRCTCCSRDGLPSSNIVSARSSLPPLCR